MRTVQELIDCGVQAEASGAYLLAISFYNDAIQIDPKCGKAYIRRGFAYGHEHEHDKAIADLNEAVRLDPKNAETHRWRGELFYGMGDDDNAIAGLDEAIRLKPDYAQAYYDRGLTYQRKRENLKADEDFARARKLNIRSSRRSYGRNR